MTQRKKEALVKERITRILVGLIFLEVAVFASLIFSVLVPSINNTIAIAGEGNVTVRTFLQVGNVYPEILSVTIYGGAQFFDLTPNETTLLDIFVVARDFNGQEDIKNITVRFFDMAVSSYEGSPGNNFHYRNNSCVINYDYGDIYEVSANCTLNIWYYAHNSTWNATAEVTDNVSWTDRGDDTITITPLLAFVLPDYLDYGLVNATFVSDEKIVNVTNAGNVWLNLSLFGYAYEEGDGLAMNCTLGYLKNISIEYERYNLTASNTSVLNLAEFNAWYKNLTSNPVVNPFNLKFRTNDTHFMTDEYNETYWRIYVPMGAVSYTHLTLPTIYSV